MKNIAIEEHFAPKASLAQAHGTGLPNQDMLEKGSLGRIEERLNDMDEAGIDMQVLSCVNPGGNLSDLSEIISVTKSTNDELAEAVKKYPERLAGFATIAPRDPDAAADELERAVTKLGLKGTMISSSEYLDEQKYWVILERAARLGVPIYLHQGMLSPPEMMEPYLTYPVLSTAVWGGGASGGLRALRLICSGVFDKYPDLKFILGHLGEGIPFFLWRIDNRWQKGWELYGKDSPGAYLQKKPSQYFKDNFYVTTSGVFWPPPFQLAHSVLGADRILFAADYPPESAIEAAQFIESVPMSDVDREKICHLNAEKLLKL